jgi:hypothetical protein
MAHKVIAGVGGRRPPEHAPNYQDDCAGSGEEVAAACMPPSEPSREHRLPRLRMSCGAHRCAVCSSFIGECAIVSKIAGSDVVMLVDPSVHDQPMRTACQPPAVAGEGLCSLRCCRPIALVEQARQTTFDVRWASKWAFPRGAVGLTGDSRWILASHATHTPDRMTGATSRGPSTTARMLQPCGSEASARVQAWVRLGTARNVLLRSRAARAGRRGSSRRPWSSGIALYRPINGRTAEGHRGLNQAGALPDVAERWLPCGWVPYCWPSFPCFQGAAERRL